MSPTLFACALILSGCSVLCVGLIFQFATYKQHPLVLGSAVVILILNIAALCLSLSSVGLSVSGMYLGLPQSMMWREVIIALQTLLSGFWLTSIVLWFSNLMIRQRALLAAKDAALLSARTDALTGIGNRHYFDQVVAANFKYLRKQPTTQQPMLVLIDLDGLKTVNDTYGHPAGDELLRTFANGLRSILDHHLQHNSHSAPMQAFRLGGDEFAILATAHDESMIREQLGLIEQHLHTAADPRFANTGVSFGTAHATKSGSFDDVLSHADTLMYAYKTARKAMR